MHHDHRWLKWQNWIPIIVLCAAVVTLFHRLFLGEVIFWGTPTLQFYPWRKMAFDVLGAGHLPLWNPLLGNGAPLLANYQTAVFYPPNWLYLVIPTEYAMGLVGLVHVIWAGLGMAVYLRRLGVERLGQGVGALAFALSGYLISRFGFLSITSAVPWLPWLMWAVDGIVPDNAAMGSHRRAVLLLGVIVAMQLLSGHAQTTFYSMVLAGVYTLWQMLTSSQPDGRSMWARRARLLTMVSGGVLLGMAVAAVQLIPTFELLQTSQRAGGVEESFALGYSFWPWRFLTLIAPNLFGSPGLGNYWGPGAYWEDAVYVGLLTLLMAGCAGGRWLQERKIASQSAVRVVPFYILTLPLVFVLSLGGYTPVFPWLYHHVPTFSMFQAPARWMLLAVFAISVLGAVGIDGWRVTRRGLKHARLVTVGGVSVLIGVAGAAIGANVIEPTYLMATTRLGITIIMLGGIFLVFPKVAYDARWRPWWEVGVLSLLAIDLVTAHWGLNPTLPADYYHQTSELAQNFAADFEGYRTFYMPDQEQQAKIDSFLDFNNLMFGDQHMMRVALVPNIGMDAGVAGANNFEPLQVGYHAQLLQSLDGKAPDEVLSTLQKMNVGVLLSGDPYPGFELLAEAGPVKAYRVPDPWPRAALASCSEVGDALVCERIEEGQATITLDEPNRVGVTVEADSSTMLVLADTFYPGWQATVDGAPVPIQRANGAFRAVDVPAGRHEVVFEYGPVSVWIGVFIGGIGMIALVVLRLKSSY
ncbi:MAG: YfhO family protein [Anaerolineae bacterium]|nr:YfhO family protein [Anaerolineae bacterium]